jgi:hypothetical protein
MDLVARLFHLIHQPIPVGCGLDSDVSGLAQRVQVPAELFPFVLDPKRRLGLAVFVKPNEDRIAFVGITAQDWFHQGTVSRRCVSVLSYDHLLKISNAIKSGLPVFARDQTRF